MKLAILKFILSACLVVSLSAFASNSEEIDVGLSNSDFIAQFYMNCPFEEEQKLFSALEKAKGSQLDSEREAWLKSLVRFLKNCTSVEKIPTADLGNILAATQALWPTQRELVKQKIKREFKLQGMPLRDEALEAMPVFLNPAESCPTTKLLNEKSLAGPFHLTSQMFGTCYVHSTVRALDYFNFSTGAFSRPTSIVATEITMNRFREGSEPNAMDGGLPHDVFSHLRNEGGCQWSSLDRWVSDYSVFSLHAFFKDLKASQSAMLALPDISVEELDLPVEKMSASTLEKTLNWFNKMAAISASWNKDTIEILSALVSGEQLAARHSVRNQQPLSSHLMINYLRKIMRATIEFRDYVRSNENAFLNFASFLLKKSYCTTNDNHFDKVRYGLLFPSDGSRMGGTIGLSPVKLRSILRQAFSGKNPQPIVLSFYSDVLAMPEAIRMRDSLHAALIVGMEYKQNKCMVQVLDSRGRNGSKVHPSYNFDPSTGSLWLPVDTLSSYVIGLEQFR